MAVANTYPKGQFIAHAGGSIGGNRYTNSVEAFENSARKVPLIELDLCRAADGLIVAHDGLEKSYGFSKPFREVSVSDFQASRYIGRYGVMSFPDLCQRLTGGTSCAILDLKTDSDDGFAADVAEIYAIASAAGVLDRIIPQVYSIANYDAVRRQGFENFILALWKFFPNVNSQACTQCVEHCFRPEEPGFHALSLAFQHVWKEGRMIEQQFTTRFRDRAPMMFIHGQPPEAEVSILASGYGIFSHEAVTWVETQAGGA